MSTLHDTLLSSRKTKIMSSVAGAFEDVLAFARAHATKVEALNVTGAVGGDGDEADRLRYREAAPLFDARGQSTRVGRGATDKRQVVVSEQADRATRIKDELKRKHKRKKVEGEAPATAGEKHFDVPNTPVTPEIEQTFKMLEMRPYVFKVERVLCVSVLLSLVVKDQHYKKALRWKQPAFFGVGTVVDDARDFYSSRVPKKQRKQTLGEELMSEAGLEQYVDKRVSVLKEKEAKLRAIKLRKNSAKTKKRIKFRK